MTIHEVFIYLRARDAAAAIAFYQAAFGAEETFRLDEPSGRIGHAELRFGPATILISGEFPELGILAPDPTAPPRFSIHLHVDDADAAIERAVAAGAVVVRSAADHSHGERSGAVRDPFGYEWLIGHAIEEVSPERCSGAFARSSADQAAA
jgi:PhnB protein